MYAEHCFKISLTLSLFLCTASLLAAATIQPNPPAELQNDISPAGIYAIYMVITLLLYTSIPLPLYGTVSIAVIYSTLLESFLCYRLPERSTLTVNVLLHVCIHVIGIHALITTQVRLRDTFMKVGGSLMVKKQLVNEKGIKEKMIHSVMPPKVADWLMKEGHTEDVDDGFGTDTGAGGSGNDADSANDDFDVSESGSMVRKR